jgi:hypothetical protein
MDAPKAMQLMAAYHQSRHKKAETHKAESSALHDVDDMSDIIALEQNEAGEVPVRTRVLPDRADKSSSTQIPPAVTIQL